MNLANPLLSIIVPVYNGAKTLQRCLDSVFSQTFRDYELIVQDGGSSDGTVDIIKSNERRIRRWVSEPDLGVCDAFNKGIRAANGEWLYFLGADDYLWDQDVLMRMAQHLRKAFPPYRIVYGREAFMSEKGEVLDYPGEPWSHFRQQFLGGKALPHQAVMHHRSLFERHGLFNTSFRMGGDYEMLLRELKDHDPLFIPDVIVAGYQFGGGSSDPERSLKLLKEFWIARKMNGFRLPGWFWLGSMARVSIRVLLWRLLGPARAKRTLDWARSLVGKSAFWTRI